MKEDETLVHIYILHPDFEPTPKYLSVSETVSLEMTTWSRSSEIVNLSRMELES